MNNLTCEQIGRLMVRRQHSAQSNHCAAFIWPSDVGARVTLRPGEIFDRGSNGCGAGLYGYSCDPKWADGMAYTWEGAEWRLMLADEHPIGVSGSMYSTPDKAKCAAATILGIGDSDHVRALVIGLGGSVPLALRRATTGRDLDEVAITAAVQAAAAAAAVADAGACERMRAQRAALALAESRLGWARILRAIAGATTAEWRVARAWIASGVIGSGEGAIIRASRWARAGLAPDRDNVALVRAGFDLTAWQSDRERHLAWIACGLTAADRDRAAQHTVSDPEIWRSVRGLDEGARFLALVRHFLSVVPGMTPARLSGAVRTITTARKRAPDRLWDAYTAANAWRDGATRTVRAVRVAGDLPAAAHTGRGCPHLDAVAVYRGRITVDAPDAWIMPADLRRFRSRCAESRLGPVVQWDRAREGAIVARERARVQAAQGRAQRKIERLDKRLETAALTVPDGTVEISNRYESHGWGRSHGSRGYAVITVRMSDGRRAQDEVPLDSWTSAGWPVKAATVRRVHALAVSKPRGARLVQGAERAAAAARVQGAQEGGGKRRAR